MTRVGAAKFVRENPGLVCPTSWKPVRDALNPGIDLVGRT